MRVESWWDWCMSLGTMTESGDKNKPNKHKMHNERNGALLGGIETNELDDGAVFDDMSIRHHPKALLAFVRESVEWHEMKRDPQRKRRNV